MKTEKKTQMKRDWSLKMDAVTWVLLAAAVVLLGAAWLRGRDIPLAGIQSAAHTLWRNLPLLLLGFLVAGLAQVLIPEELVTSWLGDQAGIKSVLLGSLVGGLVPGAPYATFPLVGSLYQSGASIGAVVSFVSAWALWSVSRLPVEMALIDPRAALIRYGVTFLVPPAAGLLAQLVERLIS